LVAELLRVKAADGASGRYLSDLRSRLGQFGADFDGKPVAEITSTEVDHWLRSLSDTATGKPLAATTRNNFRRVLIVAFNFARERGYSAGNPAEKSARAKVVESAVGIRTVEETARLLESASSQLIPYIPIGAFAGLRRAELERLDWREVDLQSRLIEVTAKKAKSARRRLVRIQSNLAKRLQRYARVSGNVAPPKYRELLDAAREVARIEQWPHNALRHSFCQLSSCLFQRCRCARARAWTYEQQSRLSTLQATGRAKAGEPILEDRSRLGGEKARPVHERDGLTIMIDNTRKGRQLINHSMPKRRQAEAIKIVKSLSSGEWEPSPCAPRSRALPSGSYP
jgi:integrase